MSIKHVPVLLDEAVESLQLKPGMNIIDCTIGDGGHSERILKAIYPNGKLLGIDVDPESVLRAKKFLHEYEDRIIFVRDNFVGLSGIVRNEKFNSVDGILFDLGWSTPQFEERRRGFSFQNSEEPLDMRYDKRKECEHKVKGEYFEECTAASVVNTQSEKELERIFKEYGEEKFSREIAKAVVLKRRDYEIETVGDLVDIILEVYRSKLGSDKDIPWIGGVHPATKVFQALRIYVNEELTALEKVLPQAVGILKRGGRLAVISFHSLEDRIVKHYFKRQHNKILKIATKKPIVPGKGEIHRNPRARSAKLRVVEKL